MDTKSHPDHTATHHEAKNASKSSCTEGFFFGVFFLALPSADDSAFLDFFVFVDLVTSLDSSLDFTFLVFVVVVVPSLSSDSFVLVFFDFRLSGVFSAP